VNCFPRCVVANHVILYRKEQYALTEAAYTLARMAQSFDRVECVDPTKPIEKKVGLALQPNGVNLRFHRSPQSEDEKL
jgi:hypothetical protein